jgi:hypothetical protein
MARGGAIDTLVWSGIIAMISVVHVQTGTAGNYFGAV